MQPEESVLAKERSYCPTIGYTIVGQVAICILVTLAITGSGDQNRGTGFALVGAWMLLGPMLYLPALWCFHWRHPKHLGLSIILALFSTSCSAGLGPACSVLVLSLIG